MNIVGGLIYKILASVCILFLCIVIFENKTKKYIKKPLYITVVLYNIFFFAFLIYNVLMYKGEKYVDVFFYIFGIILNIQAVVNCIKER